MGRNLRTSSCLGVRIDCFLSTNEMWKWVNIRRVIFNYYNFQITPSTRCDENTFRHDLLALTINPKTAIVTNKINIIDLMRQYGCRREFPGKLVHAEFYMRSSCYCRFVYGLLWTNNFPHKTCIVHWISLNLEFSQFPGDVFSQGTGGTGTSARFSLHYYNQNNSEHTNASYVNQISHLIIKVIISVV